MRRIRRQKPSRWSVAELNKMAAVQSNIPDWQLPAFESFLPLAERVLALVLECLLEPLSLGPCTSLNTSLLDIFF